VLSVGSDRIDLERLGLCFELEESTSASALLLSSIDGARAQFVREGTELLDRAVRAARLLRERLAAEVPELPVISTDRLAAMPGVTGVDPTHVMIETAAIGLTGYEADDWLRDQRQIDVELVDQRGQDPSELDVHPLPSRRALRTEQAMSPRDAFFARTDTVKPKHAVGRVSAELVTPYPPGIPAVAPGEVYNEAIVDYLEEIVAAGGFVEGASDQSLETLRVVALPA
jgi:arginine decarboxylase